MKNRKEKTERKSSFLSMTQVLVIGVAIIMSILALTFEKQALSAVALVSAVILCIIINTAIVIIDLLQSIDEKLENRQ